MPAQQGLDGGALHSDPPTVDQPDFPQSAFVSRPQVLVDDRPNVPRGERVQIERVLDGNAHRLVVQIVGPDMTCVCQWS